MSRDSGEAPRIRPLPAPEPIDVGIVAALPMEMGGFRQRLENVREIQDPAGRRATVIEGDLGTKRVGLIVGGVGQESARKATERLLAGHRPVWVISAGFGGALDPDLKRGDAILACEVLAVGGEGALRRLAIDLHPPEIEGAKPGKRLRGGRILTVGEIVRTAKEKKDLWQTHGADVVDMETMAVAEVCRDRGTRFMGLRVVSDEADEDLPPEVLSILGPTGGFRMGATMGALWKRPKSVKDLWRLYENALETSERLGQLLPSLIGSLP